MAKQNPDVLAELTRLREENAKLKMRADPPLKYKVSEKGAVSVYGLGRFPVTLYREQWTRLLDAAAELRAFIEANERFLKAKE